jgi:anti-sigma B factor antagonist
MDFVITFKDLEKTFIVKIVGDIDAYHSATFKQKVMDHLDTVGQKIISMDLSEVQYIDSAGLGSMVSLIKESKKRNKEIILVSMQPQIKKIFEMTKLDKIIKIVDTIEEI